MIPGETGINISLPQTEQQRQTIQMILQKSSLGRLREARATSVQIHHSRKVSLLQQPLKGYILRKGRGLLWQGHWLLNLLLAPKRKQTCVRSVGSHSCSDSIWQEDRVSQRECKVVYFDPFSPCVRSVTQRCVFHFLSSIVPTRLSFRNTRVLSVPGTAGFLALLLRAYSCCSYKGIMLLLQEQSSFSCHVLSLPVTTTQVQTRPWTMDKSFSWVL